VYCDFRGNDITKKVIILDGLHLAKETWSKVNLEAIRNCFRHSGFKTGDENEHSLLEKPVKLTEEVYVDCIDVTNP
jgi:hypothetical protein